MLLEGDGDEPSDCLMDTSPVTVRELRGWKIFGFATEGYSALAISVFFPIILEHLASSQGFETSSTKPGQGPLLPCNISATSYSCSISINNSWVDTTSFVFYATTISVFIQFLLFINLGALADHGGNRKNFLVGFAVTTSLLAICTLFVTSNTTSHTVLHMSFLCLGPPSYSLSSTTVIQLIIGAGIFIVMGSGAHYSLPDVYPLQIGIAVSGVWTLVFLPFTYSWLKPRPGSPLPAGENVFLFSIKKLGRTLCKVRQLGQLFIFLFAWFIYSDGFTTIIAVAILFFRTDLGVDTTSLLIAAIIAPLFAGLAALCGTRFSYISSCLPKSF
ncbi:hypothetical protein BASA83_013084 [Batrachochytrium salamandrivorans]|nr:hypothetical protein BASA83_013084 [Batrachochytrium salamandrivorans]